MVVVPLRLVIMALKKDWRSIRNLRVSKDVVSMLVRLRICRVTVRSLWGLRHRVQNVVISVSRIREA